MATTITENPGGLLVEHQRLATSGARAVLPFWTEAQLCLAIPQLAVDIPDTPAYMNGGDSDIDMRMYRWLDGHFVEDRVIGPARHLLGEPRDPHSGRAFNLSGVRSQIAMNQLHQGRFSGTVATQKANAFAGLNLETDVFENIRAAITETEIPHP